MAITVLQTGDLHVDTCKHSRINPATGVDTAMESNIAVVRHMVAHAVDKGTDIVVIAGDAFSTGRPTPQAVLMLDDALAPLRDERIQVLLMEGNHERIAASGLESPTDLMGRLAGSEPATEIELRCYEGLDIIAVPYPSKPRILAALGHCDIEPTKGDRLVAEYVMSTIDSLLSQRPDDSVPAMLTGHFTVDGIGLPGSETDVANLFSEPVFSAQRLGEFGFDYIGLSHIHTAQVVKGIHYAGSPNRLTLTDADEDKGANLISFGATTRTRRLPTPARGIYRLRLDQGHHLTHADPDDVFQVVLPAGEIDVPDDVRRDLRSAGARWVVKRTPINRKPAPRPVLSKSISPREAVTQFLRNVGQPKPAIQRQLTLADQIGVSL